MIACRSIVAVVPVKEASQAKQRLAGAFSCAQRRQLAHAMLEDVLSALAATRALASMLVVTVDVELPPSRRATARGHAEQADEGHTAAVAAAAARLAAPAAICSRCQPTSRLCRSADIERLLAVREEALERAARGFIIVPARDECGSNAVICSPADAVPLRFGDNSFFPHLAQAKACGIEPVVLRLARIALDIDARRTSACCSPPARSSRAQALLVERSVTRSLTMPDTAVRRRERRSWA